MSKITTLATSQITAVDTLTIELVETDQHPTVVVIRWPDRPSSIQGDSPMRPPPQSQDWPLLAAESFCQGSFRFRRVDLLLVVVLEATHNHCCQVGKCSCCKWSNYLRVKKIRLWIILI